MIRGVRIGALLLLWLIPTTIFARALTGDWLATWHAFHLPSMLPRFLDMDGITTGVEVLHQGGDPLAADPVDSIQRTVKYPRIWLYAFSALGMTSANLAIASLTFCALYLACMSVLISQAKHSTDVLVLLLASLSLAPLLAMERGNNDLFLFSLVFFGCLISDKNLRSAIFAVAAVLKIYPIAALAVDVVQRPKKGRTVPLALTCVVLFLFALQYRDLVLIGKNLPHSGSLSFGILSLRELAVPERLRHGWFALLGWAVILVCAGAGLAAVANAWKKLPELESSIQYSRYGEMFSAFGAMYVFTFAIASNSDYRLILLLPTIPLTLEMARVPRHRTLAIAHLSLLIYAEYAFAFDKGTEHLATLGLFVTVLTLLTLQAKQYAPVSRAAPLAEA
jgi:hypothetical protein